MDFIEACLKLISIDSSPSAGSFEAARFLSELCVDAGLKVSLFEENHNGLLQGNVIASLDDRRDHCLLLQTHLDTVEPQPFSLWTKTGGNPFEATLYNDKIFGLGAADTKLDFLCKLEALKMFRNQTLRRPVVLVGSYGEETGMAGILRLMRKRQVTADYALVGEPTGMRLVRGGKGIVVFSLRVPFAGSEVRVRDLHNTEESTSSQSRIFSGKASHSSLGDQSENAIRKMLEFVAQCPHGTAVLEMEGGVNFNTIPDHSFLEVDFLERFPDSMCERLLKLKHTVEDMEKEFIRFTDTRFSPPTPTLNIGRVFTEEKTVRFEGCLRLPPTVDEPTLVNWLDAFKLRCEEMGAHLEVTELKRPFVTSEDSDFLKVCQKSLDALHLTSAISSQAVTNEANVLSRFGVECLVFGPGRLENNAHTAHESVEVENLTRAVHFYQRVIEDMAVKNSLHPSN